MNGFESRKAIALLCYLVLEEKPIARAQLAGLFWGEKTEKRARNNLSRVISNITSRIPNCLEADRNTIQFRRNHGSWIDVDDFQTLEMNGGIKGLSRAVTLVRGEICEGLYVDGCPEFDLWLLTRRETWRQRFTQMLWRLIDHYERKDNFRLSLDYVSRLLEFEPWREEAHRKRMELLARSGQRSAAIAQLEVARQVLDEELGVGPSRETLHLYEQIIGDNLAPEAPPSPPPSHNLPQLVTQLLGREKELAALGKKLRRDDCRLLTLLGYPGVGKTYLALSLARSHIDDYGDGIYHIDLHDPQHQERSLVWILSDLLGLERRHGIDSQQSLEESLKNKNMLIVIDGFEARYRDRMVLGQFMQNTSLTFLITSHQRLCLKGEWLHDVRGLRFERIRGDSSSTPAERLFQQTAERINPIFEPFTRQDRTCIADICRLLDGHPVAIELAAMQSRTKSCRSILTSLQSSFESVKMPFLNAPDRHSSLRALFNYAVSALDETEFQALQQLSILGSEFSAEYAEHIAATAPQVIVNLLDKSHLVQVEPGCYRLHPISRFFGAQYLDANASEYRAIQARRDFLSAPTLAQELT